MPGVRGGVGHARLKRRTVFPPAFFSDARRTSASFRAVGLRPLGVAVMGMSSIGEWLHSNSERQKINGVGQSRAAWTTRLVSGSRAARTASLS